MSKVELEEVTVYFHQAVNSVLRGFLDIIPEKMHNSVPDNLIFPKLLLHFVRPNTNSYDVKGQTNKSKTKICMKFYL